MPASMMMPPAGSIFSVSGNNSAMVAAGPSPGRMPTMVPRKQPTKHQNRFTGCSATENPCSSPLSTSMSEPEHAGRQRHAQRQREHDIEPGRGADRDGGGFQHRLAEHHGHHEKGEDGEADEESEPSHQRGAHGEDQPQD